MDCKNCSYDCCCTCEKRQTCFYCRSCSWKNYSMKNICFTCKKCWKKPNMYQHCFPSEKENNCAGCNQKAITVSHVVRVPKQKNKKKWKLLEKIILSEDLHNAKPGTLAELWIHRGKIGCTLHMKKENADLFWTPKHMRDYDRWVQYMRSVKAM